MPINDGTLTFNNLVIPPKAVHYVGYAPLPFRCRVELLQSSWEAVRLGQTTLLLQESENDVREALNL